MCSLLSGTVGENLTRWWSVGKELHLYSLAASCGVDVSDIISGDSDWSEKLQIGRAHV